MNVEKPSVPNRVEPEALSPSAPDSAPALPITRASASSSPAIVPTLTHTAAPLDEVALHHRTIMSVDVQPATSANAPPATASASWHPYETALPNDLLGLVGEFLDQEEQLDLRSDSDLKAGIERGISTVTLTADAAIQLLGEPGALPHLQNLVLMPCDDASLLQLATILKGRPHSKIELTVVAYWNSNIGVKSLGALSELTLARITLNNITIGTLAAQALAQSRTPLTVRADLSHHFYAHPAADLDAICRLPQLTSLEVDQTLTDTQATSLGENQALSELHIKSTQTEKGLIALLTNPVIASLTLQCGLPPSTSPALFAAIAENNTLRTLNLDVDRIAYVPVDDVEILTRNTALHSLSIQIDSGVSLRHLAAMPSVRQLDIRIAAHQPITAEDAQLLAEKSWDRIAFHGGAFSAPAMLIAASSKASTLVLLYCGTIDRDVIDALLANPHLSELCLNDIHLHDASALERLAAMPSLRRFTYFYDDSPFSAPPGDVKTLWAAAGKPADSLLLMPF